MAYFAQLDDDNIVQQVIVVSDTDAPTEAAGQAFIASMNLSGVWVECWIDGSQRGAYPGPGWTYDADTDTFIAPEVDE